VFTALAGEVATRLDVEVRGEIAARDVRVLELAALKGVFTDVFEDDVSYVNAPLLASERGVEVRLQANPDSPDFRNLVTLRGTLADGRQVSVSGTLIGLKHSERIVDVDGFHLEIEPAEHMVALRFVDRPGVIGLVGRILGDSGMNIESMQVSRDRQGGVALVMLTISRAITQSDLDELARQTGAESARAIDLT
ncbi:MAG TPA: ACT domain-containing protein, partial [Actinopolymorphaceae bacterium]